MQHFSIKRIIFIFFVFISTVNLYAESVVVNQTKNKIVEIDNKISKLQSTITHANDKKAVIRKELSIIEKQIGENVFKLNKVKKDLRAKQEIINALQTKVIKLTTQLLNQEKVLSLHLVARYKVGEYEPLKLILNQDNPYRISRLLTYYNYIIQARLKVIHEVQETKTKLTENKLQLHQEMIAEQQIEADVLHQQQSLEQNKLYQTKLIASLTKDIQTSTQTIEEFERNKRNLSKLLKSLMQQSIVHTQQPMTQLHHKLPAPILGGKRHFEQINQGIKFFANEGEPVLAINSGKVVFSDWLKGYGLLLIIDHGYGIMSLYAHNQSLFKQKGDKVMQGEQIAAVGHTGGVKENGLYFEIRQRGKAVSPLGWLS
jgi:septal ring factor EnvC (AmiA/AmiB activator)